MVEKQAVGYLTADRFSDGRDLWLLATGTGVAPFLSILQDFEVWEKFERIILVYSAVRRREPGLSGADCRADPAGLSGRIC